MKTRLSGAVIVAMALLASPVLGAPALQQMDHATATEVIIYTDSSKAVVRRQSAVRLVEGENTVSFEWASDKIDAASIRLHGGDALTIGEVVDPAGGGHSLEWSVRAPAAGDYSLTISFLLDGLKWSADYAMAWSPGQDAATLGGWLTVTNESGVRFEEMGVRFVLGRSGARDEQQAEFVLTDLQTLEPGEAVRSAFLPLIEVSVRTIYRIDSEAASETVKRILQITPPAEGALARTPLPSGPLTIVMPTDIPPAKMLSATLSYEPAQPFEVTLGEEPDIVVERRLMERKKTAMEFDRLGKVSGFDTIESYEIALRSHLREPVEIELVETVLNTWELETRALHVVDDGKALMLIDLPAEGQGALEFTLVKHSGTRIP
jgi:hypothetical protein